MWKMNKLWPSEVQTKHFGAVHWQQLYGAGHVNDFFPNEKKLALKGTAGSGRISQPTTGLWSGGTHDIV